MPLVDVQMCLRTGSNTSLCMFENAVMKSSRLKARIFADVLNVFCVKNMLISLKLVFCGF